MIFAIDNYTTADDTQSLSIHHELIRLGHQSILFDNRKQSIYDIFDSHQPNFYITHGNKMSNDLIHYIVNNKYDVDVLLNIHNMPKDTLNMVVDVFQKYNIKSSFWFSPLPSKLLPKISHINMLQILPSVDSLLLSSNNNFEYHVDKAIIIYNQSNIKQYEGSYHFVSYYENNKHFVDIMLPELSMGNLYRYYNEIIFRDYFDYLPQGFFNAIASGCKVYFDLDNEEKQKEINELVNKLFKTNISLQYSDNSKLQDFSELKQIVLTKHTEKNRVKTILSNIRKTK
jgi:hypothetical protein